MLVLTAIFLLTALLGVWAAYDLHAAWLRFGLIAAGLLGALLIVYSRYRWGERALFWAALACALLAALLGAYFMLTYNWRAASGPSKFAAIQQVGLWIQAHRPPFPVLDDIHPNVAGNTLAVLLPLATAAFLWAVNRRQRSLPLVAGLALALYVALLALILSASRGSWLGLAAGAGGAFLLANGRLSRLLGRRGWTLAVILGTALACGLLFWAVVTFPRAGRLAGTVTGTAGSAAGRAALWREMLDLFRDYPFTGSGLGSTTLVFSSYVLLVHVGFIGHSHNIFLQVGIEQGVAGLLAFAALLGLAAWRVLRAGQADGGAAPRRATPRNGRTASNGGPRAGSDADAGSLFRIAAGAALIVLVISGMTDAGIYVSKAVPALFIALGFVLAAGQVETRPARPVETARRQAVAPFVFSAAALVLVIVALLPSTRAALQSNLGAVAQTRAELSVYEWPKWPIQDALRRSPSVDLVPALARYGAALALNPQDVTANRRLGQIELSRGDYETARRHLERAYQAAPRSPASRQLLGESYAIAGDSGQAAALWRGLDLAYGQLDARQWWYQHIGEKARAAAISQAARLIN